MRYWYFKAYLTTPVGLVAAKVASIVAPIGAKITLFLVFYVSYNMQLNMYHVLTQVNKSTFRKASGITKVIYQDNMATPPHNFATAAGCLSHHGSNLFIDCKII